MQKVRTCTPLAVGLLLLAASQPIVHNRTDGLTDRRHLKQLKTAIHGVGILFAPSLLPFLPACPIWQIVYLFSAQMSFVLSCSADHFIITIKAAYLVIPFPSRCHDLRLNL